MISTAVLLELLVASLPMVTSDSACPSTMRIEAHLATLLSPDTAEPGRALVEDLQGKLLIRLLPDGQQGAERTIVVDGTCEERAMAAAVAIATWWQAGPGRTELGWYDTPAATAGQDRRSTRIDAEAAKAKPDVERLPATVVTATERVPATVTVAAGGFASVVSDAVAPGMRVGMDLRRWKVPLAFRLGLSVTGAHSAALAVGHVRSRRLSAEMGAAWLHGPWQIDASGIVSRLLVDGTGYTSNDRSSGFSLGLSLGARLGWAFGRTTVWVEARAVGWPQPQRIVVVDSTTAEPRYHDLPHGELQAGAGLSFRLF